MPSGKKGSSSDKDRRDKEGGGGGWVSRLLWVSGIFLAWAAVEIAFKPWLKAGRAAIRKSLDPDYDVDDELDNNSSNPQQGAAPPPVPAEDPPNDSPKKASAVDDPLH